MKLVIAAALLVSCFADVFSQKNMIFKFSNDLMVGITYQEIAEKTGASTATISRVNRSLIYGAGGYQMVLSRMPEDAKED